MHFLNVSKPTMPEFISKAVYRARTYRGVEVYRDIEGVHRNLGAGLTF